MNSYKNISRVLILLFLSLSMFTATSNAKTNVSNEKIILIDQAHGQYINSSLLTEAIKSLTDQGFTVIPVNTSITAQILTGADLLLIPNPGRSVTYTSTEIYAISQWMAGNQGKGIIMLTNPLDNNNDSLDGHPYGLNLMLQDTNFALAKSFDISVNDYSGFVVNKYQNTTSDSSNLILQVNSSLPLPDVNKTMTIETKSSSVTLLSNQSIVNAGYDSFEIDRNGAYTGQDQNLKLFGGINFKNGRIVFGGSTLMFSDLPNPSNGNKSWFSSKENGLFLTSLVKWSLNVSSANNVPEVSSSFFMTLMLTSGVIGVILVVVGIVLYSTGKEMKIFDIDLDFLKAQSTTDQEETGLTKSQKRLQQRMKNK